MAPEFDVADCERGGAGLCASKEFDVECDSVRLVLRGEGAGEVRAGDFEDGAGYVAAIGD